MMKVLVCDDDGTRADFWRDDIEEVLTKTEGIEWAGDALVFEVERVEPAELGLALQGLTRRQSDARTETEPRSDAAEAVLNRLDSTDLLVIDHDLSPEEQTAGTATLQGRSGEGFSQLARRFSSVGYIVLVNRGVQRTTFDLTMTRFQTSFADLNVTEQELDRPSLWWGVLDREKPFRPSHWPLLFGVPQNAASLIEGLDLNQRVLPSLGFVEDQLLDFAREQLDPLGDDPWQTTFDQVVETPGLGLEVKDAQPDEALRRRIAVFGVRRWLDRYVLAGQNVLVDLPHLLDRLPSLRDGLDLSNGVDAATFLSLERARRAVPRLSELDDALFAGVEWLDRPVWRLSSVDYAKFDDADDLDTVFCEDTMQMRPLDEVREFEAAVPGPYTQRYAEIVQVEGDPVQYMPRSRLL